MKSNLVVLDFENEEQVLEFIEFMNGHKTDAPWNLHKLSEKGKRILSVEIKDYPKTTTMEFTERFTKKNLINNHHGIG
jgi:N-acetyl-beta-hexosaminidase